MNLTSEPMDGGDSVRAILGDSLPRKSKHPVDSTEKPIPDKPEGEKAKPPEDSDSGGSKGMVSLLDVPSAERGGIDVKGYLDHLESGFGISVDPKTNQWRIQRKGEWVKVPLLSEWSEG